MGVDADFRHVLTVQDSDCTVSDLPSDATVRVRVIAVNSAGRAAPPAQRCQPSCPEAIQHGRGRAGPVWHAPPLFSRSTAGPQGPHRDANSNVAFVRPTSAVRSPHSNEPRRVRRVFEMLRSNQSSWHGASRRLDNTLRATCFVSQRRHRFGQCGGESSRAGSIGLDPESPNGQWNRSGVVLLNRLTHLGRATASGSAEKQCEWKLTAPAHCLAQSRQAVAQRYFARSKLSGLLNGESQSWNA